MRESQPTAVLRALAKTSALLRANQSRLPFSCPGIRSIRRIRSVPPFLIPAKPSNALTPVVLPTACE